MQNVHFGWMSDIKLLHWHKWYWKPCGWNLAIHYWFQPIQKPWYIWSTFQANHLHVHHVAVESFQHMTGRISCSLCLCWRSSCSETFLENSWLLETISPSVFKMRRVEMMGPLGEIYNVGHLDGYMRRAAQAWGDCQALQWTDRYFWLWVALTVW